MSGGDGGRRVIDGRFALEARLGGGGMGTVWRARDLALDRPVALKEVRPPDRDLAEYDPEAARLLRARVLREARALARVEHPNVVTIHHIVDGGEDTYPWLVMELVTGGSLQDFLERGPMAPADAARLGRELLAALRAAHAVGIQHRDVKPANVLLRPDGRPVLTDFGIAAIRESTVLTATGSIIGTPDYMAPERITGERGGPDSDLWSLAMMLYVAVEGHHPLRRATTLATLAAVLNEQLPPPVQAGPLTGLLTAVLVKDPAARPGPEALDRMLAEAAEGRATAPHPAPSADPATSYRLTPPPAAPPAAGAADTVRAAPGGRNRRRGLVVGSAAVSVLVLGVALWQGLPGGSGGSGGKGDEDVVADRSRTPTAPATGGAAPATGAAREPEGAAEGEPDAPEDLLTPGGVRHAVDVLRRETGSDRFGSFTVYPEYVSASVMLKGSDTKFDRYLYRLDNGVMKLPASGTLSNEVPMDLDAFDWDALPRLLARAEKDLNVAEPTTRYLVVDPVDKVFDTPQSLSVYFSDAYGSGYLQADPKGEVTEVHPAES
ncbi:serine/threonine-protein kinase [Streptomyces sp. NPDC049906]|uniref:serine/threonine-protein kinase n=1 Tax=Streptomyces sp. NPDC049906 TaxID=3155656 RepID=UPI0034130F20